ncbi:MAG TPA: SGNH/GDSL hydrolase family protein [Candidatus Dormibacteraeota bacterium]
MSRRAIAALLGAVSLLLAGCSPGPTVRTAGVALPGAGDGPTLVDVAVGASETVGAGTQDRLRSAWPQLLYLTALQRGAVFYNFGIPGATVAQALAAELPPALAARPDLVTVWLNVNDLLAAVPVAQYESRLTRLVHALRRSGATRVLVANTPWLDRLPAYLACLPDAPVTAAPCGLTGMSAPPPAALDALVDEYNAAIARVVVREGAELVDLHAFGEVPELHPEYVSEDGFHPSESGHAAIAAAFAAVLRRSRGT